MAQLGRERVKGTEKKKKLRMRGITKGAPMTQDPERMKWTEKKKKVRMREIIEGVHLIQDRGNEDGYYVLYITLWIPM